MQRCIKPRRKIINSNIKKEEVINRISELSPQLQVILWSIRSDDLLTKNTERILYSKNGLESAELIDSSLESGLSALLYKRIKTLDRKKIDPLLYGSLKKLNLSNIARNLRFSTDLEKLFKQFNRENFTMISYKGPVAGILAYNDLALRYSADLDIMIKNTEFKGVIKLLLEYGFKTSFKPDKKTLGYIRRSWRDISMSRGDLHLDVHQQVAKGPSFFRPHDNTWESSIDIQLNNDIIKTFSLEDTLVFQAINNAKDGFARLKQVRDIAGLISNHPKLDWQRIMVTAKKSKSYKILLISLKMAQLLCGAELPAEILMLTDKPSIKRSLNFYLNRLFFHNFELDIFTWYLTVPRSLDSFISKIRFLIWFGTKPSPRIHQAMFKLPGFLFFLFPLIHPFYLLYKYGTKVFFKKSKTAISRQ